MMTLEEYKECHKIKKYKRYFGLNKEGQLSCWRFRLYKSYIDYIYRNNGNISPEDYDTLTQDKDIRDYLISKQYRKDHSELFEDAHNRYVQSCKRQERERRAKEEAQRKIDEHQGKIALWTVIVVFAALVCLIGIPILYIVGKLAWTGFEIFADGSFLGFIFGIAAVIITLGMFATLVKAILGK